MLDMTESIAPKSDQLNAEDLLTGPRTFTIAEVKRGSAEQPIDVHLVEFPGRPFRPSKTVRRIMVGAWGPDASTYAGRRMTLYRDPDVRFGGMDVGGIRVSHMSHIKKPLTMALTVTRGKRAPHVVQPLADEPAPTPDRLPRLYELMTAAGFSKDDARAYLSRVVGRKVAGSKDLTPDEVASVIEALEQPTDEPTPDDGDWPDVTPPGDAA